jgi:hypothetical protein
LAAALEALTRALAGAGFEVENQAQE